MTDPTQTCATDPSRDTGGWYDFAPARRAARYWGVAFIAVAVTVFVIMNLAWVILGPPQSGWDSWALGFLLGSAAFFSLAGYALLRSRPFSVRNGLITLPWPIRTKTGARRRVVHVREIDSLKPATSPEGYAGLRVTLLDGTVFHLWDPDLPPGAREHLQRLRPSTPQSGRNGGGGHRP